MKKAVKRGIKKGQDKYSRKKLKGYGKGVICYCPQVCPDVMRVQLKYQARKTPSGGGVTDIVDYVFRGNGPYDPDAATGGNQPMGYDQWSAFYKRYRVLASKVDVIFINNAAVSAIGYITPLLTSGNIVDKNEPKEHQYGKVCNLGQDAGNNQGQLSSYISTAQIRGGPNDIVDYEKDLSSSVTSNPIQEWYWHIGAYGIGTANVNFEVDAEITVTYYVEFFDRETLTRS